MGEGDVEVWVVRAIGKKLLEARIDQMRRTVAVTKCMQRTFSTAQWRSLLAQLGAWKVCPKTLIYKHGGGFVWDFVRFRHLSKGTQVCTRGARPARLALCHAHRPALLVQVGSCMVRRRGAGCSPDFVNNAHLLRKGLRTCRTRAPGVCIVLWVYAMHHAEWTDAFAPRENCRLVSASTVSNYMRDLCMRLL